MAASKKVSIYKASSGSVRDGTEKYYYERHLLTLYTKLQHSTVTASAILGINTYGIISTTHYGKAALQFSRLIYVIIAFSVVMKQYLYVKLPQIISYETVSCI